MLKQHNLARSIQEKSIHMIITMLEYKAKEHGRTLTKVSQWYPSTQLCNNCGYQNKKTKTLQIRQWTYHVMPHNTRQRHKCCKNYTKRSTTNKRRSYNGSKFKPRVNRCLHYSKNTNPRKLWNKLVLVKE